MLTPAAETQPAPTARPYLVLALSLAGLAAFLALFLAVNNAWYEFMLRRFPSVGDSAGLATLWGVASRLHLIVPLAALALWKPRLLGLQAGQTRRNIPLLAGMLLANCGVVAGYLWLSGSSTPYSGNEWLLTEAVTVPLVEEVFWRGLVFALLLLALRTAWPERASGALAAVISGLAFGLLHANNLVTGVPLHFVVVQVLNATVWGILYGAARARTGSVYPPVLLHAAMNLVVVLF